MKNPVLLIVLGFVLVLLGFLIPLLMVLKILESTYFFNFFAYTASIAGLFLGLIGMAYYVKLKR